MTDIPSTSDDSPITSRRADYSLGDVLDGRYRIESVLGSGGMGVVYRVTQMFVDKQFALKTLIKEQISEVKIRRFQQEARTVFALDHPNIVAVKDFGILEDMTPFLVMELITGETLGEILKRSGRLTLEQAIPIFVQTCFGLGYAHEQGIIHRDIKPSNIMLLHGIESGAEGNIKILDFGIAKFTQFDANEMQALTKTGEIFGSPFYMSPEQCAGERVDYRADIYSLGCVLFEALTGTPPCVGESALSTMMQHQISKAPTLKEASMGLEFPPELEKIVAKMLDKAPEKRYQKLGVVAHHLGALSRIEIPTAGDKTLEIKPAEKVVRAESKTISLSSAKLFALLGLVGLAAAICAGIVGYFIGQSQAPTHDKTSLDESQKIVNDYPSTNQSLSANSVTATSSVSHPDLTKDAFEQRGGTGASAVPHPKLSLIPAVAPTPIVSSERVNTVFAFPKNMSVGMVRIDNQSPKSTLGLVTVGKKSKVTFYTRHSSSELPDMLDKFRPDDLNGLEVVFDRPEDVFFKVRNWTRLEELSFFDSLIKAMPRAENHDETPVRDDLLPAIDKLTTLTSLGLCGPLVTGNCVAKMGLIRSLRAIKLKRIKNVETLLAALPQHNNIEEVWLIDEKTDNRQLELLTNMQNLKSLTIKRSNLEPDSLPIFLRMKKLKHLTLDRNTWSDQDKQAFKKAFPNIQFEPVIDIKYWFLLPDYPVVSDVNGSDVRSGAKNAKPKVAELQTADSQDAEEQCGNSASARTKNADIKNPNDSLRESSNHLDLNDSKGEFGLLDNIVHGNVGKVPIANVIVRPEVLEDLGASPKEIRTISKFPFELINSNEREFAKRLSKELKQKSMWSHP